MKVAAYLIGRYDLVLITLRTPHSIVSAHAMPMEKPRQATGPDAHHQRRTQAPVE